MLSRLCMDTIGTHKAYFRERECYNDLLLKSQRKPDVAYRSKEGSSMGALSSQILEELVMRTNSTDKGHRG